MPDEILQSVGIPITERANEQKNQIIIRWIKDLENNISQIQQTYNQLLRFEEEYKNIRDKWRNILSQQSQINKRQGKKSKEGKISFSRSFQSEMRQEAIQSFNNSLEQTSYDNLSSTLNQNTIALYTQLQTIRYELTGEEITYSILITTGRGRNKKILEKTLSLKELVEKGFLKLEGRLNDYRMRLQVSRKDFIALEPEVADFKLYKQIESILEGKNIGNIGQVFRNLQLSNVTSETVSDEQIIATYNETVKNLFSFLQGGDIGTIQVKSNIGGAATVFSVRTLITQAKALKNALEEYKITSSEDGIIKSLTKINLSQETLSQAEIVLLETIQEKLKNLTL